MRILVSGASGLIGSALVPALESSGHEVLRLVRREPRHRTEIPWDPAGGDLEASRLTGLGAVVHLAGENIGASRWTEARKRAIRDSRIRGTELLSDRLARLDRPPQVMVSASAIGYYGDRGEESLDEASTAGRGFLAELARQWEAASRSAEARGVRVVHLRNGLVLTARGGVLARLLPIFRLGLGGPIGAGRAWWSWIAIDDLLDAIQFAIGDERLRGAVNGVAPQPLTNAEFTRTLGRVLGRPTWFRVPEVVLRLTFGEMAEQALLASARVFPGRLTQAGFSFRYPRLEAALRHLLASSDKAAARQDAATRTPDRLGRR